MQSLSFPYKTSKPLLMIAGVLFGGGGAYFMYLKSTTNTRGLILNRIIELDPTEASLFYIIVAIGCAILAIAAAAVLLLSFFGNRVLEITTKYISVPKNGLALTNTTIPWQDITDFRDMKVSGQRWLEVRHKGGKVSIAESMLSADDFNTVRQIIMQALGKLQQRQVRRKRM